MPAMNGQNVSLSDNYVLLLQETIKESRVLRVQVSQREEKADEVKSKVELLFTKVDELCEKVSDSSRKRKRSTSLSVKVPRQCRVSVVWVKLLLSFLVMINIKERFPLISPTCTISLTLTLSLVVTY